MKKHKKCTYHSFKTQGKVFAVALVLTWLGIALITDEPNPGCWPSVFKPMLLIVGCLIFGILAYDNNCIQDHYTEKEKEKESQ
jgi:hypothetical protein